MTETQTQLKTKLAESTQKAFDAFCEDISGMFDCSMQTIEQKTLEGPISQLRNDFKRVTSINTVDATGILDGQFGIWFDQAAIFILSGIVVMLPEKRIRENVKNGGMKEAQSLNDAIKELGNLMTGSWDRIFRECLQGHKHIKQGPVFVGQPWQNPTESLGMDEKTDCLIVSAKIKVADFDPVLCAAVYPIALMESKPKSAPEPQPQAVAEQPAAETNTTPDAETPEQEADNSAPIKVETIEQPAQANPVSNAIEQMVHPVSEKPNPRQFPDSSACGRLDLNRPVHAFSNPNPVWIDPDSSIQNAILLMQQHNTGYLLAGKDGQLEGIMSRSDAASAISPYTKSILANYRRPQDDASFQLRCRWFLSRPVRAIPSDTPLWAAIDIMCKYAVRSLVILDTQQRVSGLITMFDIVRHLISTDESVLAGSICQTAPFAAESNTESKPFAAK